MSRPQDHLYARYSSAVRQLSDAENVLFYNVGTTHFQGLANTSVIFERSFAQPEGPQPHESFYTTRTNVGRVWQTDTPIAAWHLTGLTMSPSSSLLARAWLAMRQAGADEVRHLAAAPIYGLRVTVETPRAIDIVGKVKPLLDGVISGMHYYRGSRLELVASRVASILGADEREISELLTSPFGSPLGPRELLWPFGAKVQWNPADDGCVHAMVQQRVSEVSRVHVELCAVRGDRP